MKRLVLLIILASFTSLALGQEINEGLDKKTQKKYEKQDKKKQKEEELEKSKAVMRDLVNGREYVLEANNLSGKSGAQIPVVPSLNFFAVDSATAVIQIGSVTGLGYNGVGGITDEAKINRYEISESKAGFNIKLYAASTLTSYTIFLNISASGNATARVTGLSGGVINFIGRVVPMSESIVYKGQRSY